MYYTILLIFIYIWRYRLNFCALHPWSVVALQCSSVGLDVVASIGRPWLLVLSSKGKSRATKAGRNWQPRLLARSMSLPYWLSPWPCALVRSLAVILSVALHRWPWSLSVWPWRSFPWRLSIRGQSCQWSAYSRASVRLSMSWPPSVALGYWLYPQRVMSRATKAGRNWSPRLLARSMSFPWQLVAVVIGSVASSIRGGSLGVDVIPLLALHPWQVSASMSFPR